MKHFDLYEDLRRLQHSVSSSIFSKRRKADRGCGGIIVIIVVSEEKLLTSTHTKSPSLASATMSFIWFLFLSIRDELVCYADETVLEI